MGFWPTGHADDVLGDEAADTLAGGLRFHEQMTGRRPTLQELLDATAHIIRSDGDDFLADAGALGDRPIEAVLEAPAPPLRSRPGAPIDDLLFALAGVYRDVAGQYVESGPRRKPRLTELLAALAFVLSVEPEDLLRETEGLSVRDLRVAPAPAPAAGEGEAVEDLTRPPGEGFLRQGYFLPGSRQLRRELRVDWAPHWAQHLVHERVPGYSLDALCQTVGAMVGGRGPEQMSEEAFPPAIREQIALGLLDQCNGLTPLEDLVRRGMAPVHGAAELAAFSVLLAEVRDWMARIRAARAAGGAR